MTALGLPLTLRGKLAVWSTVVLLLALALYTGVVYVSLRQVLWHELDERLHNDIETIEGLLQPFWTPLGVRVPHGESALDADDYRWVQVWSRDGRLLFAFDQMRRFTANAAHELRTPLTALRSSGQAALTTAASTDDYRDAVADMLEDTEQMSRLLETMMLLAQADAGIIPVERRPVDLDALVTAVANVLHNAIRYGVIAAYNRRVDRPGEPELRIFPKYDDPEILKVGNPFLRPQFTHAYEVGYARSWTGGSASTALYRRDITDSFLRIFAIDDSNPNYDVVNRIFENAGNSTQTGVQLLVAQDIGDPWRVSGSVNWYQNDIDPLETILFFPTPRPFTLAGSQDDTWDVTFNNQIQLPRAIELQASYIYYAARNVPQGRERSRSSVDLSAKWPVMERAELLFTFTDIFNDFAIQHDIEGRGFTALYQNFLETQAATVNLRVRF